MSHIDFATLNNHVAVTYLRFIWSTKFYVVKRLYFSLLFILAYMILVYIWCYLSFYIYDVSFIPALDAPGASKRSWVPTPDAPSAYFLVAFQIIYQVQFQNENATWNNPWNLLITINLNVKYFHNSIDFTERLLQVYIPRKLGKTFRFSASN